MHTFSYICNRYKIQIYIYKLLWFRTGIKARFASHLIQNGIQSAFRESFDSKRGFKARLVSHLNQNEASKRVSRVIWFRTGLFKARFASHLVQNGDSKRVSRVIWFKTGLQSAFRESFDSERGFKARFANHLIQNGFSVLNQMTHETHFEAPFWVSYGHQSSGHTRK